MLNFLSIALASIILSLSTVAATSQEVRGKEQMRVVESAGVRVIKTDRKGVALNKVLGFKANVGTLEGTACLICEPGPPKECREIDCDKIVIVTTDD